MHDGHVFASLAAGTDDLQRVLGRTPWAPQPVLPPAPRKNHQQSIQLLSSHPNTRTTAARLLESPIAPSFPGVGFTEPKSLNHAH